MKKLIIYILFIGAICWAIHITRTLLRENREVSAKATTATPIPKFYQSYDLFMDPTEAQGGGINQTVVYQYKTVIGDWVAFQSVEKTLGDRWQRPIGTITRNIKFNYSTLEGVLEEVNDIDGAYMTVPILLAKHVQGGYRICFLYEGISPLEGKLVPLN